MRLVEEALFMWRDAERLMADMPPRDPEREVVSLLCLQLRKMASQVSRNPDDRKLHESSAQALAISRRLLLDLRERHEASILPIFDEEAWLPAIATSS